MSSPRVRALIEEFATKIENALKAELRDAIDRVGLGIVGSGPSRTAAPSATNGHLRKPGPPGKGIKRDAGALDALSKRFIDFVSKNPGLRIEQINKALGTTTKDLALPVRKLVAAGEVKAHGQRRSTTYAAPGGAVRASKKRSRRRN